MTASVSSSAPLPVHTREARLGTLIEQLASLALEPPPSADLLTGLAQLDPVRAAILLTTDPAAVRDALGPTPLRQLLSTVVAAGLDRAAKHPSGGDSTVLVKLLEKFPDAVTGDLLAEVVRAGACSEEVERVDRLLSAALEREPTHPALLRLASDRALRAGSGTAHALLTRLARADDGLANVRYVWQARKRLPAEGGPPVRIALLSSFTIDTLVPYVDLECRALGLTPEIYVAPFNTWTQEMLDEHSGLHSFDPEIAFLAVSIDDLVPDLAGVPSLDTLNTAGEVAVERVLSAARRFASSSTGVLVVHAFHTAFRDPNGVLQSRDTPSYGRWIAELNLRLAAEVSTLPRGYVLDVPDVLIRRPSGAADNPKMRHFGAMRLGDQVLPEIARSYANYIAPLKGLTRKCVVLDLDNTLWGGIVGEDGLHGIRLGGVSPGSEYRELQQYLLTLTKRGILLAINSKNNPDDALEVLRAHDAMVLREECFSAVRINWLPKPDNMRSIAEELNIGLDSFIFIDDNPHERALMRQALPQVLTPELPTDPARYRQVLEAIPQLQSLVLTDEDRTRVEQYHSKRERERVRTTAGSLEEYLQSLDIRIDLAPVAADTLPRVHQLFQRTNQFNLTTRRYEAGELAARMADPHWRFYALRVADRFGDHGLVATALVEAGDERWTVDSLLMSCRVIGYGVETTLLAAICDDAKAAGAHSVIGEYIETKKNAPCRDFYDQHGFVADRASGDAAQWRRDLHQGSPTTPAWIRLVRSGDAQ